MAHLSIGAGILPKGRSRPNFGALPLVVLLVCPPAFAATGKATYYTLASVKAEGHSGITTSGEPYDESAFTLALPHRRFGRSYRVCRIETPSRCVVARHTDFGPGRGPRARGVIADLSPAVYDALGGARGITKSGLPWGEIPVTVEPLTP